MTKFVVKREEAIQMLTEINEDMDLDEEDMTDYSTLSNEELAGELCMSGLFADLTFGKEIYEEDLVVE
jgi:hypothetical protein